MGFQKRNALFPVVTIDVIDDSFQTVVKFKLPFELVQNERPKDLNHIRIPFCLISRQKNSSSDLLMGRSQNEKMDDVIALQY